MTFDSKFKTALEEMIPKDHDDYKEIQYSDTLYVHVWSHPDGEGAFEIEPIIPHTHNGGFDFDASTMSEVPQTEAFYQKLKQLVEEVTGDQYDLLFQLSESVTDGTWEQNANVYSSFKLTA